MWDFRTKFVLINNQQHPFHLVSPSPWPILLAFSLCDVLICFVLWFHDLVIFDDCFFFYIVFPISILFFLYSLISWLWDIIIEATFEGAHTFLVQRGLRIGFALFIVSEIIFFFSFFWAFFYFSISPSIWIGNVWPPLGIQTINPWALPYLNTWILLFSGIIVTVAHKALISTNENWIFITNWGQRFPEGKNYRSLVITTLFLTIYLGIFFTILQLDEYTHCQFSINDGIYGSVFFILTGFHGFHVLIGTIFLFICLLRFINYHFTKEHHIGLEIAIWYWHFVDVVWIFLFIFVYVWGSF